jgi:putative YhdH/YhfP family quinone oxidoreductase
MTNNGNFSAYQVKLQQGTFQGTVRDVSATILPGHEVLIKVEYSSLNYKDALSARGLKQVTKNYPHIPGIDAAGTVLADKTGTFKPGSKVIVTGYDLGTNTSGGWGTRICVPASWVVELPRGLALLDSMLVGTAGFTALYGVRRLQAVGVFPEAGDVLVTGASGGVGSLAVFALNKMGYRVVAATTKLNQSDALKSLGACEVIAASEIGEVSDKPLLPRKWFGCIETVGGELLDAVIRQTAPKGAVACCGNILGMELHSSILPFILRGISLLGIDSAYCVRTMREQIWQTAADLNLHQLPPTYHRVIKLPQIDAEIERILAGTQTGRVVIRHE